MQNKKLISLFFLIFSVFSVSYVFCPVGDDGNGSTRCFPGFPGTGYPFVIGSGRNYFVTDSLKEINKLVILKEDATVLQNLNSEEKQKFLGTITDPQRKATIIAWDKVPKDTKMKLLKALDDTQRMIVERLEGYSESGNFITQCIAPGNWDSLRNVNFGAMGWKDAFDGVKRGIAIRVAAGVGNKIGEGVDELVSGVTRPLFSHIKSGLVHLYRVIFKGGKVPFDSVEIGYLRERIMAGLNLMLESGRSIAEYKDRDRQQRQRHLLRGFSSLSLSDESEGNELEQGVEKKIDFATQIALTCVVSQLDSAIRYIAQRKRYYGKQEGIASKDDQVLDLATIIQEALRTMRKEIVQAESIEDLLSPEFKAILPGYIEYISQNFEGLAALVKDPAPHDQQSGQNDFRGVPQFGTKKKLPGWGNGFE